LILLDNSWLQLLIPGALGVIFTQFAFLGHEASHRQVLASPSSNDLSATRIFVALPHSQSFGIFAETYATGHGLSAA
jgi:fatty acid desaturase